MSQKAKKKRGRPIGGKAPDFVRRYWREHKHMEREAKRKLKESGKK